MSDELLKFDKERLKKSFEKAKKVFSQRKVQLILIFLLLSAIIIFGMWMRVQNLPLLKDQTTGEYIPTALDPFYFLRVAETIIEQGGLPEVDNMRIIQGGIGYTHEILPWLIVYMHKIANIFGDYSIQYIDVISPVVFFGAGLIVFFFLIYYLTHSKVTSLISTAFLMVIPSYIYRSTAGFSDHDIVGMFAFFSVLLSYSFVLKYFDKEYEKRNLLRNSILFGLLVGFLSSFTIASWGGVANFVFLIIPLSSLLFWIIKSQKIHDTNTKHLKNFIIFYSSWIFFTILSGLIYGFSLSSLINRTFLGSTSILSGITFLFILVDFLIIRYNSKIYFVNQQNLKKYRIFYSISAVLLIGLVFLTVTGRLFSFVSLFIDRFIHPFGAGRTGLTVAENAQPYLNDWISQTGKRFFWLVCLGIFFVGLDISKGLEKNKNRIIFLLLWAFMVSGILFSRISPNSLFNGSNFISILFYFISISLFFLYSLWLYFNHKINIKSELLLIFAWLIFMLVAGRSAVRVLFIITPFACFMGGYAINSFVKYSLKTKDDLLKIFLVIATITIIIISTYSFFIFVSTSSQQAKYVGPSANAQWQEAMNWVRENTSESSVFVHWWDYGFWVEYLGKRATLADGGHFEGDFRDHLIGRYLLTTPKPETALSFMKSNNVSHLLIDPTDLGKYGAYSRIGSDNSSIDRFSTIPLISYNSEQSKEENGKETRVYLGGVYVDEDIVYGEGDNQIFLPQNGATFQGAAITLNKNGNQQSFNQPVGIFVYQNKQFSIPIRYLEYKNNLNDFGGGLDAVIKIIPSTTQNQNNVNIDYMGMALYLSPKVSKSLFAQLYLLNNAFNTYPTINIAHSEPDPVISNLKSQGANLDEFAFIGGFRGPIKIWKVDYPENILVKEEFQRTGGTYAEFDNLILSN
ncbi:MAG: STT3 domain-containing protein [archaeon]